MPNNEKHIDLVMRLVDRVTRPLVEIRSQMQRTAGANQRLGRSIRNIGRSISGIGDALVPVSGAIVGVATAGGRAFVDFDATITSAGAKASATAEDMRRLRESAMQIGADFPISASQAAEGMDRLAAAGYDANAIIGAMPAIVTAAVASGEDMALTSDVVSNALNIWNLRQGDVAANASHVADVVQQAANQSSLGMQDFGVALQYAGAPAATLGVSLEELSTAMAIMKNNGIDASTIGTTLRSTFTRLSAPPKAAAEALAELGIQTTNAEGNFIGLQNVIDQLRVKMDGMSDVQQVGIAKALAGEEAYSGLLAMIRTSPQAYQQMADSITQADGASAKQFEVMKNTVKGSLEDMMGSVEALALSFGDVLSPQIQHAASMIGAFADWMRSLDPETKLIIGDVLASVVAFTASAVVIGRLISTVGSVIRVYGEMGNALNTVRNSVRTVDVLTRGLNTIFGLARLGIIRLGSALLTMGTQAARAGLAFLTSPIGWVILAIAAAVYLLYQNWDSVEPYLMSAWSVISGAVSAAGVVILSIFQSIRDAFGRAVQFMQDGILGAISFFGMLLAFITGVFTGGWSSAWAAVRDIFTGIFTGLTDTANGVIQSIRAAVNGIIDGMNSISVTVPDWVPVYGGQNFGLNVPRLYSGDEYWGGGPAMVHDKGAEIIDLPSGSRIVPHDRSLSQAYSAGQRTGGSGMMVNVTIGTAQMGSDADIKELARKLADEMLYQLEIRAVNLNEGAI